MPKLFKNGINKHQPKFLFLFCSVLSLFSMEKVSIPSMIVRDKVCVKT